jgi:hypothetical protein
VLAAGLLIGRSGLLGNTLEALRDQAGRTATVVRARLGSDAPDGISVDIKYKHYMKLMAKRQEALAAGLLVPGPDDFVPATVRYRDRSIRARVRLKGDRPDHWEGEKYSLRIELRGDETLFGIKRFSIQHPNTRDYALEWFYHRALRREGLIGLRYDFINVTVNGDDLGIYALEEHFEKHLIESNERREGPVVRFNEDLYWAEAAHHDDLGNTHEDRRAGAGAYQASEVDGFGTSRWLEDPARAGVYRKALGILEGYRRGEVDAADAFDLDQLARFFVLSDLFGSLHSAHWRNARFYYNPVTSRLEPIGFDSASGRRLHRLALADPNERWLKPEIYQYEAGYWPLLLADADFQAAYLKALERFAEADYADALLADLADELEQTERMLQREFPEASFSGEFLRQNHAYMRRMLDPVATVRGYVRELAGEELGLEVANLQVLPVQLVALRHGDSRIATFDPPVVLDGRQGNDLPEYRTVSTRIDAALTPNDLDADSLEVVHRFLGTRRLRGDVLGLEPPADPTAALADPTRFPPDVNGFDFLRIDSEASTIAIRPGTWTVSRHLRIPEGYRVVARGGTRLRLGPGVTIVSHSPLDFHGEAEDPIVIESASDVLGEGLLVLGARGSSTLRHVLFRNLGSPDEAGWALTGAVTFYESPVEIYATRFVDNQAEDSLNIVRSPFTLERVSIHGATSDALDVDFSDGEIRDSEFFDSTNDAIDVSGAVVQIHRVTVRGAGDKAVSAGEASSVDLHDSNLSEATVGVASKDSSRVGIVGTTIREAFIDLAAYRKKPEFGGGEIGSLRLTIDDPPGSFVRDPISRIELNTRAVGQPREDAFAFVEAAADGEAGN